MSTLLDLAATPSAATLLRLDEATVRLAAAAEALGGKSIPVGRSREGRPLTLVRLGRGEIRSFWYAGPHANEALGVSTVVELAERLASNHGALDGPVGFDVLLCIDPDGHVRNENWFADPIDPAAYYRGFYRPGLAECPDWDLPVDYANASGARLTRPSRLPESAALQAALELCRPAALVALHNAEVGGVHFPVQQLPAGAAQALTALASSSGFEVEERMLDDLAAPALTPGVFALPRFDEAYEAILGSGHPDPASLLPMGESAASWAGSRYQTATVVTEIPYWTPRSLSASGSLGELAGATAAILKDRADWLTGQIDATAEFLGTDAWIQATKEGARLLGRVALGLEHLGKRPAGAELATAQDVARLTLMFGRCLPLRFAGMLGTALRIGGAPASELVPVEAFIDREVGELRSLELRPHPIARLVDLQLAAGLLVTDYVRQAGR